MARWEPGAAERLQRAALDLFVTRGFEQTTATDIAESVGLTSRTFFRYFGDKRDVLFYGQERFAGAFLAGIDAPSAAATPMECIRAALASAATLFPDERRELSRTRQTVIDANPTLLERERHKLAELATLMAGALRARGVNEPAATLAAESGATVFGLAFGQWIQPDEQGSLAAIATDLLAQLALLVVPRSAGQLQLESDV